MPDLYPNLGNKRLRIPEAIEEREEKLYQKEQRESQRADKDEAAQMQAWDKFVLKAYKANGSSAKQKLIGEYSKMYQDRGWGEFSVKDFVPKNEHYIEIVENDPEEEDGEARYFANVSGKSVQDRLRRYTDSPEKVIHYSELLTDWGSSSPIEKARKLNAFKNEDPEGYEILKDMQGGRKAGNRFTEANEKVKLVKNVVSTLNSAIDSLDSSIGDSEDIAFLRDKIEEDESALINAKNTRFWRKSNEELQVMETKVNQMKREMERIQNSKRSKDEKVKLRDAYINQLKQMLLGLDNGRGGQGKAKDEKKDLDANEVNNENLEPLDDSDIDLNSENLVLQPTQLRQDSKLRMPGNSLITGPIRKNDLKEEIKINPETNQRTSDNPELADMLERYYNNADFHDLANEIMPVIEAKVNEEEDEEQVLRFLQQLYKNYQRAWLSTPTIGEHREQSRNMEDSFNKLVSSGTTDNLVR